MNTRDTALHVPAEEARVEARTLVEIAHLALTEGGSFWLRVTGQSMSPLLREGDSVLLVGTQRARIGDIVLVHLGGRPILHRLVSSDVGTVQTKGDACGALDPVLPTGAILGRAVLARRGGALVALIPSAEFGVAPLARYVAWFVHRCARNARRTTIAVVRR